jgi:hypothetical protein
MSRFKMQSFLAAVCACLFAASASAQLAVNQTEGFGKDQLMTFTYQQNFSCVHGPFDDLDHNGLVAAEDPDEFQTPRCVVNDTPPTSPSGEPLKNVEKLYVIAPFFETDPNEPAFTPELGAALKSLFGFVPDAFKTHPGVAVQCPEPGPPTTTHTGAPGTCTMHASKIDLGPALAALGKVPPGTSVIVPTLNHSHVIDQALTTSPIWWQIISVLVTDPAAWPDKAGTHGITSLDKLRAAQAAGQARPDTPTNFFLFFGSRPVHH